MAFDFPAAPTEGQIFTPPGGPIYTFRSNAWRVEGSYPPDPPSDGKTYGRKNAGWVDITVELLVNYLPLVGGTLTGDLTISKANAALMLNKAANGQGNWLGGYLNGVPRWITKPGDATAEIGSNSGSDFAIDRYSDAGAFLGTPFKISRDTGLTTLTGDLTISKSGPRIHLDKAASGESAVLLGRKGTLSRWAILLGGASPESTGNLGSDFNMNRYDDAGTLIDQVLGIARATAAISGSALATALEYWSNSVNKLTTTNGLWAAAVPQFVTYAASITLNFGAGINFVINAPTGSMALQNPINMKNGQTGIIRIYDASGAPKPITFGVNWWFPVGNKPANTTGLHDMIFYHNIDGANLFCTYVKGYTSA